MLELKGIENLRSQSLPETKETLVFVPKILLSLFEMPQS